MDPKDEFSQMSDSPDTHAHPGRRTWGGVAVFAAAVIIAGAAALWAFTRDDTASTGLLDSSRPEVGMSAPNFALVDVRDPERVVHLSDFRGRAVVLNWYASWCGPCREEIPDFLRAHETLGDDQLVILGVNLDEPADRALGFLEDLDATFPAVLDSDGRVYNHYLLTQRGMPTTYFIDAEGVLRDFHIGRVEEDRLVEALATVGLDYAPPEPEEE